MKPTDPFSKVDQMRFRTIKLEQSQVPPAARVMFCRGRKTLGYGDVAKLGEFLYIPKDADTICLSASDYDDVKSWRDGR